jgi:hypothetical protein
VTEADPFPESPSGELEAGQGFDGRDIGVDQRTHIAVDVRSLIGSGHNG